ncbi:MAG TPA: hypothetical protein VHR66_13175 [Gemmataceae bacterium]|jgi:CysZ protein|nr:hypothetical protein [Gemmataceae bacterium]
MASRDGVNDRGSLGIWDGVRAFAGGTWFIIVTPSVWGWSLVPIGFMAFFSISLCGLSSWGAWESSKALFGETHFGTWALACLLGLIGATIAVLIALTLAQPCAGFALEAICRAQERALVGRATPAIPYWQSLRRNLKVVAITVIFGGGFMLALTVVEFFFPPAAIVTIPVRLLVGGWLMAWNFLDYPFGLRGMGIRDGIGWIGRHFGAVTLFGVAWWTLVFFPGAILLLIPMGVAGATRMVVEADGVPRENSRRR